MPRFVFLATLIFVTVSCYSQKIEGNIVLINIGNSNEGRTANVITKLNVLNPKVISLDIAFPEFTGSKGDRKLYHALQTSKRLVMASIVSTSGRDYYGKEIIIVALASAAVFYDHRHTRTGFVSAKVEEGQILIPNQFIVWQKGFTGDVYHHFSVVTAMAFDSLKAAEFIKRSDRLVDVDYGSDKRVFRTFSAEDVIKGKLTEQDVEGKIIMMGFLGPGDQDRFLPAANDPHHAPTIYGVEYLANIVAQILEHK